VIQTFTIQADTTELPAIENAHVYHGDSWALVFQLNDDATPTAHDLTGATVAVAAKNGQGVVTALTATIAADPTTGTVTVSGNPAADRYLYGLQVTEGTEITTWARGELIVDQDITPP
jgi:hypothetical protein